MDELKNALGINDDSSENETLYDESPQPDTYSSTGDNAAESILAFVAYASLIAGIIVAAAVGYAVGSFEYGNKVLGWGVFFVGACLSIITWAACMVIVNISNNIRHIKRRLHGRI